MRYKISNIRSTAPREQEKEGAGHQGAYHGAGEHRSRSSQKEQDQKNPGQAQRAVLAFEKFAAAKRHVERRMPGESGLPPPVRPVRIHVVVRRTEYVIEIRKNGVTCLDPCRHVRW